MIKLPPHFNDRLLDILLEINELDSINSRGVLLRGLPKGPVDALGRASSKFVDLSKIVDSATAWGQIESSGEWALTIIARNALRIARGTSQGGELERLLAELETTPAAVLPPLDEVIIGRDERLALTFLHTGLAASRAVAKLVVPRLFGGQRRKPDGNGTGWMIAPDLLITNYHVIKAREEGDPEPSDADLRDQALQTVAWFGYDERDQAHSDYGCAELIHYDSRLDFALLRMRAEPLAGQTHVIQHWGFLRVPQRPPLLRKGDRLNIIQHPLGGPKQLAIRSNFYLESVSAPEEPRRIRYLTDTEPGSSGSPVLDDEWSVVALHHAAVEVPAARYKGELVEYHNQGVLIHAIIQHLPESIRREITVVQGWSHI